MAETDLYVPVETRHGDGCTCRPVGQIHLDLVAASRACPGDRNPHRAGSLAQQLDNFEPPHYPGSIAITWPAPTGNSTLLPTWPMQIHDHDTGKPLLAVTGLRMVLGGDQWDTETIAVDLKMFVDAEGLPLIGAPAIPVRDPNKPEQFYSRVFRCHVAEMRIREDAPAKAAGIGGDVAALRKGDQIVIRDAAATTTMMRVTDVRGALPGEMNVDVEPVTQAVEAPTQ